MRALVAILVILLVDVLMADKLPGHQHTHHDHSGENLSGPNQHTDYHHSHDISENLSVRGHHTDHHHNHDTVDNPPSDQHTDHDQGYKDIDVIDIRSSVSEILQPPPGTSPPLIPPQPLGAPPAPVPTFRPASRSEDTVSITNGLYSLPQNQIPAVNGLYDVPREETIPQTQQGSCQAQTLVVTSRDVVVSTSLVYSQVVVPTTVVQRVTSTRVQHQTSYVTVRGPVQVVTSRVTEVQYITVTRTNPILQTVTSIATQYQPRYITSTQIQYVPNTACPAAAAAQSSGYSYPEPDAPSSGYSYPKPKDNGTPAGSILPTTSYNRGVARPATSDTGLVRPAPDSSGLVRPAPDSSGLVRPAPDSSGLVRPAPDFSGLVRPAPDSSGLVRPAPDFSGLVRPASDTSGLVRPAPDYHSNSFGYHGPFFGPFYARPAVYPQQSRLKSILSKLGL